MPGPNWPDGAAAWDHARWDEMVGAHLVPSIRDAVIAALADRRRTYPEIAEQYGVGCRTVGRLSRAVYGSRPTGRHLRTPEQRAHLSSVLLRYHQARRARGESVLRAVHRTAGWRLAPAQRTAIVAALGDRQRTFRAIAAEFGVGYKVVQRLNHAHYGRRQRGGYGRSAAWRKAMGRTRRAANAELRLIGLPLPGSNRARQRSAKARLQTAEGTTAAGPPMPRVRWRCWECGRLVEVGVRRCECGTVLGRGGAVRCGKTNLSAEGRMTRCPSPIRSRTT